MKKNFKKEIKYEMNNNKERLEQQSKNQKDWLIYYHNVMS